MNIIKKLSNAKRANILSMLCEGSFMRSTSRIADVSISTVAKFLADVGAACEAFHNEAVRGVKSKRVQCDEIWSVCYAKRCAGGGADLPGNLPQSRSGRNFELRHYPQKKSLAQIPTNVLLYARDQPSRTTHPHRAGTSHRPPDRGVVQHVVRHHRC